MASKPVRFFAVVSVHGLWPRVRHFVGFPPELTGGQDQRELLPVADILVLDEQSEGNVFLYRIGQGGEPCGDTWHQSVDDARHQAEYEYGDALGEWHEIPGEISDPQNFAILAARLGK